MKFSYPIEEITSLDSFFKKLREGGFYPIGISNVWHGGIHIEGSKEKIHAIADGEIISIHIPEKHKIEKTDKREYKYSIGFVLIRHKYEYKNKKDEKKQFVFYSLYNHLLPYRYREGDEKVFGGKSIPEFLRKDAFEILSKELNIRSSTVLEKKENRGVSLALLKKGDIVQKETCTAAEQDNKHWAKSAKYKAENYTKVNYNNGEKIGFIATGRKFAKTIEKYDLEKFPLDTVNNCKIPVKAGDTVGYAGYCESEGFSNYSACHIEVFTVDEKELKTFLSDSVQDGESKWKDFTIIKDDPNDFLFNGDEKGDFMKKIVKDIDKNKDGKITKEELQKAIQNENIAKKLSRIITYHKSDWTGDQAADYYVNEYGEDINKIIKKEENPKKKSLYEELKAKLSKRLKERIINSGFWSKLLPELKNNTELFYFHPIAFVEMMMGKCICKEYNLVWGNKIGCKERKKVIEVSENLGIDPNWLMTVIALETAKTFSPSIDNGIGFVGLIQFGEKAATTIGTTQAALVKMSFVEQMNYVQKHLNTKKALYKTITDLYLAVLYPIACGHGSEKDYVVLKGAAYRNNPLFFKEKDEWKLEETTNSKGKKTQKKVPIDPDGKTYVWEIAEVVQEIYNEGKANRTTKFECRANNNSNKQCIIRLVRKWEYDSGTNSTSSTVGTFTIDNDSLTGYILEPFGASTTQSNQDKRIPAGEYNLTWHISEKYSKNKYSDRYLNNGFPKVYNKDVSQNRGILIHRGSTGKDSTGCLLPGDNITVSTVDSKKVVTGITGSKITFNKLIDYIEKQEINNIKIIITENYEEYK